MVEQFLRQLNGERGERGEGEEGEERGSGGGESRSANGLKGWLARLVWDPREGDYRTAMRKVVRRRQEIALSRDIKRNKLVSATKPNSRREPVFAADSPI